MIADRNDVFADAVLEFLGRVVRYRNVVHNVRTSKTAGSAFTSMLAVTFTLGTGSANCKFVPGRSAERADVVTYLR